MKFISFGSGSSGNCYYLSTGSDAILIDVGVGIRLLKRHCIQYGVSLASVNNILLTHDHADHIKSVGSISSHYNIPVYATELVHEGVVHNPGVRKKIDPALKRVVEKGKALQIGEFNVTPFGVPHDSTDNVGYVIGACGVTFSIITDCGHLTDDMQQVIHDSDYLVIEANHDLEMLNYGPYSAYLKARISSPRGHLSNEDCGNAIAAYASSRLRHVWLCHLSEHNNNPRVAFNTVDDILQANGINVGKDLELTVLNRKIPTGIFEL